MAKDFGGFQQDRRRCPATGKPLKLTSRPPSKEYDEGWERTFGKAARKREGRRETDERSAR